MSENQRIIIVIRDMPNEKDGTSHLAETKSLEQCEFSKPFNWGNWCTKKLGGSILYVKRCDNLAQKSDLFSFATIRSEIKPDILMFVVLFVLWIDILV